MNVREFRESRPTSWFHKYCSVNFWQLLKQRAETRAHWRLSAWGSTGHQLQYELRYPRFICRRQLSLKPHTFFRSPRNGVSTNRQDGAIETCASKDYAQEPEPQFDIKRPAGRRRCRRRISSDPLRRPFQDSTVLEITTSDSCRWRPAFYHGASPTARHFYGRCDRGSFPVPASQDCHD